jgi:hypothetical protein
MLSIRNTVIVLGLLCTGPVGAMAQTTASPAVVPSANANVWNGHDHQPTAASAPPLSARREKKVDTTLNALNKQLLDQKLPKVPAGAP